MREEISRIIRATELHQQEQEWLVEQYIKIRKDVDVKINIRGRGMIAVIDLEKLQRAFNDASEWFFENDY